MSFPTSNHFTMLKQAQRSLSNVQPLIAKAKACGVDCGEYEQGYVYLTDTLNSLLREFFPDQITPPSETGVPSHVD